MASKNQNQTLIIGAAALTAVGAIILLNRKNESTEVIGQQFPAPLPGTPATTTALPAPISNVPAATTPGVNKDLLLKIGSKGNEVKVLQGRLGITMDGAFGPQTEVALFARKGLKQITLKQYETAPDMNNAALKVGDHVMANKKPVGANKAIQLATGGYADSNQAYGTFEYGKEIGKIVGVSVPTKTAYAVSTSGIFADLVWVKAADVVKI